MGNDGQECIDKPGTSFITFAAVFKFLLEGKEDSA
jgi:hypothetical protein